LGDQVRKGFRFQVSGVRLESNTLTEGTDVQNKAVNRNRQDAVQALSILVLEKFKEEKTPYHTVGLLPYFPKPDT
jgi:hypothetical protein